MDISTPGMPEDSTVRGPGRDPRPGQRFGHVTGRRPAAGGPGGHPGSFLVRDDETGLTYAFSFTDIVTEGLRTIRTGERVRFLIDHGHATYVIRLDLPDVEAYYR